MPFHFVCPHCGLETLVEEAYSGQAGPCAECGEPIAVPHFADYLPGDRNAPASSAEKSKLGPVLLVLLVGGLVSLLFGLVLLRLLFPGIQMVRTIRDRSVCEQNLRRIGKALLEYHDDYGCYPPAFIADDAGKPMHSWRVLILPYLNAEGLHERYDFNKPWDSPENAALTKQMPDVFACAADPEAKRAGETNYMIVRGRSTMFPGAPSRSLEDLKDGAETTILVVETPAAGVTWLEPRDLNLDRLQFTINSGDELEIGSHHSGGVHVLTADGKAKYLDEMTPPEYVEGMLTIDGGEDIPTALLDE